MQNLSLKIETTPIRALKLPENPVRTHSKRQIRQLMASIDEFGFVNPVLIDDNNNVIAGCGRVRAAAQLGMTSVPTVRLSHLSETQRRAYVIADNRLAEKAGWDRKLRAVELQELIELDFDLTCIGVEEAEADLLIDEGYEAEGLSPAADDQLPASRPAPVSRLGDVWILDVHRVLCADARVKASYDRLLLERKADLVSTDPPYNVRINGHVSGRGRIRHGEFAMASGEMTDPEFTEFLKESLGLAAKASRDGSLQYVSMDWRHLFPLLSAAREIYDHFVNLCVWNKDNGGMGSLYRSKHELVAVFKVGDPPHTNNVELGRHGRNRSNVWDYAGVNSFRRGRLDDLRLHPTVKPVALVADIIRDASRRSDLVLDPFAGSGTTIIAAEKTGRRACALEIDPHYVDIIVERWQVYTGRTARLEGTTDSFEDVAEQRRTCNTAPSPAPVPANRPGA